MVNIVIGLKSNIENKSILTGTDNKEIKLIVNVRLNDTISNLCFRTLRKESLIELQTIHNTWCTETGYMP